MARRPAKALSSLPSRLAPLAPFLVLAACGREKPAAGVAPGVPPARHSETAHVSVLAPTSQRDITTLAATIDLAGVALGAPTVIRWQGPGGAGIADGTDSWRAAGIPLVPGENRIVLTAETPGGSSDSEVIVRRNQFLGLRGRPAIHPEAGFQGDDTEVIVTAALDAAGDVDGTSVEVVQSDAHGGWAHVIAMSDDGKFDSSGDEIPGDGVFAGRFHITKTQQGDLTLAVAAKSSSGAAGEVAAVGSVPFVSHLSQADYDAAAALVGDMQHAFDAHQSDGLVAAYAAAQDVASQSPDVKAHGISDSGSGVWVLTNADIIAGTLFGHPDERGAAEIGNHAAWSGGAFENEFAPQDESVDIAAALAGASCPAYDVAGAYLNDAVTIDQLRRMTGNGIVALTTHGTSYAENDPAQPVLDVHEFLVTGEPVTVAARQKYELDLKTHRLAIGPLVGGSQRFMVSAKFIEHLPGRFPGSLVYGGACRSFHSGEIGAAFLAAGAATYLGYSDMVKSAFAYQTGKAFFDCLLGGRRPDGTPSTTGDCFDPALNDGGTTELRGVQRDPPVAVGRAPAYFKMLGRPDLTIAAAVAFANGGFEGATFDDPAAAAPLGWERAGDARVMSALGGYAPTEGTGMGLISTGLGFTQTNGEVAQTFCIPATAKSLGYDWNLISAEFKSFCGNPKYQDNLKVTLEERGGATTVLQAMRIDDLCATVTASLFTVPDVGYTDNDGQSFATGWGHFGPFDISPWAGTGRPVTLRFALSDVGDSIYDTVVLLDGIKIE